MAGVLFVVCVPTAKHEADLQRPPAAKEHAAAAEDKDKEKGRQHKFLKAAKKSEFHKSESHLFNNQQQAATKAAANPKLFRAVTESALDANASQEALNIFNNVHNNLLAPPNSQQNQGKSILAHP